MHKFCSWTPILDSNIVLQEQRSTVHLILESNIGVQEQNLCTLQFVHARTLQYWSPTLGSNSKFCALQDWTSICALSDPPILDIFIEAGTGMNLCVLSITIKAFVFTAFNAFVCTAIYVFPSIAFYAFSLNAFPSYLLHLKLASFHRL